MDLDENQYCSIPKYFGSDASFIDTILWSADTWFCGLPILQDFEAMNQDLKLTFMELLTAQKRILVQDKDNRMRSVVDEISCYGDYSIQGLFRLDWENSPDFLRDKCW